ncbi:MAG TPA: pyridoxamine 5'-phosphate oxidase family protein [Acidobacteriaceae bacterium]
MSFGAIAFTPLVKELQERYGSRRQYERMEQPGHPQDGLSDFEQAFIAERDSFYWANISASGWPYVQHRGGPRGFLKVLDDKTLAFADFRGNRQYISTGNLLSDDRVAIIMVDYPRQARLKILAHTEILEAEKAEPWLDRVRVPGYKATVERVFLLHIAAWDWNCPQHITPRYTAEEIRTPVLAMEQRVQSLEQENTLLRQKIAALETT